MKWPCGAKMYFLLLSIYVVIGGLLGAPVDEDILDQLLSMNIPVTMHTPEEQTSPSIAPLPRALSTPEPSLTQSALSTARDYGKQELGLSIDDNERGALGMSTASREEKLSTSSKHLLHDLVSTLPTEMAFNHFVQNIVNTRAKPLDLASTKPFLPVSSVSTKVSGEDEKLAWYSEVTTPVFPFSSQPPVPPTKGNLQNSSTHGYTHLDKTESRTMSSEDAESNTFKLSSVEQALQARSRSILSTITTLPEFSAESDVTAYLQSNVTSLNSDLASLWPSGSPNSSQDSGQLPDVLEVEYSTDASPGTNRPSDVSEDVYSTASAGTNGPSDAVSEGVYATAVSAGISWPPDASEDVYTTSATNWPSDVSEDVYSVAASAGISWSSDAVSEDVYSTAVSPGTNRPSDVWEDVYSTAASLAGTSWSPDVVSDVSEDVYVTAYSTTASLAGTTWSPDVVSDVSEDVYSTASSTAASFAGTSWSPDVVSDVSEDVYVTAYSTAASFAGTTWSPDVVSDVSEDVYSTAYSTTASLAGTSWSPDVVSVSEDVYSTASSPAASFPGTSWPPDVWEDVHSAATYWPSFTSEAELSMGALHTEQTTLDEDIATTSGSEYFSISSPTPNFQPSASEVLSPAPNLFEDQSTSLDSTSYRDPFTSSPANGIYLKPNVSEMQISVMTGVETEATSFSIESSVTLSSRSHAEQPNPLLLQFEILDRSYIDSLNDSSSEAYQELETVVKGTLEPIFYARYGDRFLGTKILSFASSDIVRTVLTHVYRADQRTTDLEINGSSVVCNGYSLTNLESEKMLIEFTALSTGFGPWSDEAAFYQELLQRLSSWVVETLAKNYLVQEFKIGSVVRIQGDVNVQGTALLTTPVHVNDGVLLLLNNLVDKFVDLRSLKVNGSGVNVGVLPLSFVITNRKYNSTLRDSRSAYFCSLGKEVTQALQMILKPKYTHFMQVVTKQFRRGSVVLSSDLIFLNSPPAIEEVLDVFFNSVDSRGFLAGSNIAVDVYSFTVAGARLDRPYRRLHFPGFGIAIILLCGLAIIVLPILAFLCWKYRFCVACQKSVAFGAWNVERENASIQIALPEVTRESYKLHEEYVNYSFAS
ncbi:hypothetical protein scyTo_0005879 [Scyliorhinus torazame]|uniref:SEA domain-containing protein n=1 Tax=Scyliorhinus torazame TaxID=75743 RepID=A0A401PDN5_SCYTO|nr:hypothetical protein [Scyliorhinus torazame]